MAGRGTGHLDVHVKVESRDDSRDGRRVPRRVSSPGLDEESAKVLTVEV